MNGAHLHLVLNHIPVVGIPLTLLLLLWGMFIKSREVKMASMGLFVLMGVLTVPVYLTGEPAEEVVEHMQGISEDPIEEHEKVALYALISVEILALFALFGFIQSLRDSEWPKWFSPVVLLLSLIAISMIIWTANQGGKIRHPETRPDFTVPDEGPREHHPGEVQD